MSLSSTSPLRFLLIGCGGIVEAHLPAFLRYPDRLRLVAACDPSASAREGIALTLSTIGPVETYASHEEAIKACCGKVDAALITTPHFLHFPQARDCVKAGIPVLVEKPVCNNLKELQALHALVAQRKVLVVAGQNRRYEPEALWAREWFRARPEAMGSLRTFELRGWQNILAWIASKPDKNADFWILDKERAGGGVVVSLLVHYIDMIRNLSGQDFVEATATGRFDPPFKNGAESSCCAILKMSGGACGTLHANYLCPKVIGPNETFSMIFEKGSLHVDNCWRFGSMGDEEPDGWDYQFRGIETVPSIDTSGDSSFVRQLLAFADAVTLGTTPMSTLSENFNTMATVDAIYESLRHGGNTVMIATAKTPISA